MSTAACARSAQPSEQTSSDPAFFDCYRDALASTADRATALHFRPGFSPLNEFVRSPVPDTQTTSAWRIASIKVGVVIALPAFLTGAEIGSRLGLALGTVAILAGCLLLAGLCALTGTVAARSRLPTAVITQFAFGRRGAKIVNLVLATTLIGWFAVTVELFADSLGEVISQTLDISLGHAPLMLAGGAAMVVTTVYGFGALALLSKWAVPVMILVLIAMAGFAVKGIGLESLTVSSAQSTTSLGIAISAVVGGPAAGTVIFPDISRFARSPPHGRGAALLSYGIGMPLVLVLVSVTAVATGEKDLVFVMMGLLGVPALVFLVLAAWTTNAGNLYSGSLFLSSVFSSVPHRGLVVLGGVSGIGVALLGATSHFVPFLVALGIAVPPIAGIYIVDFLARGQTYVVDGLASERSWGIPALVGWLLGVVTGYATAEGFFTLTGIPACDSIGVSAGAYFVLRRLAR